MTESIGVISALNRCLVQLLPQIDTPVLRLHVQPVTLIVWIV